MTVEYEEVKEITENQVEKFAKIKEFWIRRCIRKAVPNKVYRKKGRTLSRYLDRKGYRIDEAVENTKEGEEFIYEFRSENRTISTLTIKVKYVEKEDGKNN